MAGRNIDPPRESISSKKIEYKPEQKKSNSFRSNIRNSFMYSKGAIDVPFFAITIALMTIGVVMLFSASYPYAYQNNKGDSYYFFTRQIIFAVIGLVLMYVVSKINFKAYKALMIPIAAVTIALLGLVLVYHVNLERTEDFRRWIPIGPFTLQPSDIAKFTIVVILAWYFDKFKKYIRKPVYGILIPAAIILFFAGLIYAENHLSCTVLIMMIGIAMMFCGGAKWQYFVAGLALVAAVAIVVIKNPDVLPGYQGDRIRAWLDKGFEPLGRRWQTNNSLYAIGSGGFWGVGLGNSKQKYLYVSEPQNDFIFSIVCEELGFFGSTIIIALFGLLFVRGIQIAKECTDRFSALLVTGIVSQVAIQVAFNILVVTDTFPNTGIALPFFSYGGTALLMLCVEMGVVLSVSRRNNLKKV